MENGRKETEKQKAEYFQLSSNANKSQLKLQKILEKFNSNPDEVFQKELKSETQKTTELKQFAEEAKYEYENKVVISSW